MPANAVVENVLGTIGAVCWTVQLLPQVWKSWRIKSTKGLSPWFLLTWGIAAAFLGVYAIVQNLNIPLILQPQLFGFLSLVSWGQCHYYNKQHPGNAIIIMVIFALVVVGGLEAGMVFIIRQSYNHGNHIPVQSFGIISSILLSVALFPQYVEIYRHKEVIGISITFMIVDMLGGVFSDLSLAFSSGEFDVIASISYSLVVVLDGVVIIAAMILNPRAVRRRHMMALDAQETATSTMTDGRMVITTTGTMTRTISSSTPRSHGVDSNGSRSEMEGPVTGVSEGEDGKSQQCVEEKEVAKKSTGNCHNSGEWKGPVIIEENILNTC